MKKPYSKPDILFESFALSTSIAAGCEEPPNTQNEGCGVRFGSYTIFTSTMIDVCNRTPEDKIGSPYDQYCYHVPQSDLNIFFS